MNENKTYEIKD